MENKKFTEYNPQALTKINDYFHLSGFDKEPIKKEITFYDIQTIGFTVSSILEAIAVIGEHGEKKDLNTCTNLAELALKLMPNNELEFLDDLLTKRRENDERFIDIKE